MAMSGSGSPKVGRAVPPPLTLFFLDKPLLVTAEELIPSEEGAPGAELCAFGTGALGACLGARGSRPYSEDRYWHQPGVGEVLVVGIAGAAGKGSVGGGVPEDRMSRLSTAKCTGAEPARKTISSSATAAAPARLEDPGKKMAASALSLLHLLGETLPIEHSGRKRAAPSPSAERLRLRQIGASHCQPAEGGLTGSGRRSHATAELSSRRACTLSATPVSGASVRRLKCCRAGRTTRSAAAQRGGGLAASWLCRLLTLKCAALEPSWPHAGCCSPSSSTLVCTHRPIASPRKEASHLPRLRKELCM
eukprot:scaffold11435_cov30-Tisochrysis_lutea.AAC.5